MLLYEGCELGMKTLEEGFKQLTEAGPAKLPLVPATPDFQLGQVTHTGATNLVFIKSSPSLLFFCSYL